MIQLRELIGSSVKQGGLFGFDVQFKSISDEPTVGYTAVNDDRRHFGVWHYHDGSMMVELGNIGNIEHIHTARRLSSPQIVELWHAAEKFLNFGELPQRLPIGT